MRILMRGLLGVLLLWIGSANALEGREGIRFQTLSLEQGLSQSIVECIIQDNEGFLWLGTEDGLNRYDGYHFTVFKEDPTNPNSLSHDNILCLLQDKKDFLWIGTFHGALNRYDPRTGRFLRFHENPMDPKALSSDVVRSLKEDDKGDIWIGTDNGLNRWSMESQSLSRFFDGSDGGQSYEIWALELDDSGHVWMGTRRNGLLRFNPLTGEIHSVITGERGRNDLRNSHVMGILLDRSGALWVGTNGEGLFRRAPNQERFSRYRPGPDFSGSISSMVIRSIFQDRSGTVWLATNNGLNRYNGELDRFDVFRSEPTESRSLGRNEVHCVMEDRSGVLWVGTYGGGVSKSIGRGRNFLHYRSQPGNPNSLSNNIVWSICPDPDGILWIGTHGGGLDRFDRKRKLFRNYRSRSGDPKSISDDRIRVVFRARNGILWLGTNGGGLNRFDPATGEVERYLHDPGDPASISHDEIRCVYEDVQGDIWVGTLGGGLNCLDPDTGLFSVFRSREGDPGTLSNDVVRTIYESPAGVLWIGTYGGGLNRLEIETGNFSVYRADPENPTAMSNDYVFSIHEDGQGVLWLGTEGGLNRFDRETGRFERFSTVHGLPDNTVYGIVEDDEGFLWLSTNNGISRFDPREKNFQNYSDIDGLQGSEFNGGSYSRSEAGELFFGGINGFNAFFPNAIKQNNYVPPVVITAFRKNNRMVKTNYPIHHVREITLSPGEAFFSFEFAALDYTVPEKNRYAYKMEGLRDEWIETGADNRVAAFTALSPGKYTLIVKGSNNDGLWNEKGTRIRIVIPPPIWRTWWFQWGSGLMLLILGVIMFRRRMRSVLKKTRMETELMAAHEAQMSIMPQQAPGLEGLDLAGICVPASAVGGDFYDFLWDGERQGDFGVVVGDVSGKGMKAAMTAVMADGIIFSTAESHRSIAKIMECLNESLCRKTDRRDFVAILIAAFKKEKKALHWINSGLPDPLLKRGDSVRILESAGSRFPPGICRKNSYTESRFPLLPSDVIVFMTDGITEAMNPERELYGQKRLAAYLGGLDTDRMTAKQIAGKLRQSVVKFMGEAAARDDMTLVVVKKTDG